MATGGTELLHQFSKCLSECGIENYMIYPDRDGIHCPTPPTFEKYGVKYISRYIDASDSVLVLAETQIHFIDECKKGTAMIWWLSVDNYFHAYRGRIREDNVDIFGLKEKKNVVHFVQSHYAKEFVNSYFSMDNCYFLMDYINDEITEYALMNHKRYVRERICLYNPKKGYEVLKPIIEACKKDITWIPLIHMKPLEIAETMCKAMVYVDFGSHPGKDRIPREAAVCGCCVLTNQKGSAGYDEDVVIPEQCKIEDTSNVSVVLAKIYDLIDNYDDRIEQYATYRDIIRREKSEFIKDLQTAIQILKEKTEENMIRIPAIDEGQCMQVLESISNAATKIYELSEDGKVAHSSDNLSGMIDSLLTIDFVLQRIREKVYAELIDLV